MKTNATTTSPRELAPIEWRQLCAILRTTISDDPSEAEWKLRSLDRLRALGFRAHPAQLDRAMAALRHLLPRPSPPLPPLLRAPRPDPTIVPRGSGQAAGFTPIGAALPTATASACGNLKPILGRPAPLRCTRERGHDGAHGVHSGGVLFIRWGGDDAA